MSRSRTLSVVFATLAAGLAACSGTPSEHSGGIASEVAETAFHANNVLDDRSLLDVTAMTQDGVQKFLETTPWGGRSGLADFSENGQSAAAILHRAATENGINPLVLLVRLQMEHSLVRQASAPATVMTVAFGCGCPDTAACADKYKGFASQADCAAGTLRRMVDRAGTPQGTVSGWKVGETKKSLDDVSITPANAATAALYTYTPWVGETGGGRAGIGGASLHHDLWVTFAAAVGYRVDSTDAGTSDLAPLHPDAGRHDADVASDPAETDAGSEAGVSPPLVVDAGTTVACRFDGDCGGFASRSVCDFRGKCVQGCRVSQQSGSCAADEICKAGSSSVGQCVRIPDPPAAVDAGPAPGAGHATDAGAAGAEPPPPPIARGDQGDDEDILSDGHATPSSNGQLPSRISNSNGTGSGSEREVLGNGAGKGCSASGSTSEVPAGVILAALAFVASRRRRSGTRP